MKREVEQLHGDWASVHASDCYTKNGFDNNHYYFQVYLKNPIP